MKTIILCFMITLVLFSQVEAQNSTSERTITAILDCVIKGQGYSVAEAMSPRQKRQIEDFIYKKSIFIMMTEQKNERYKPVKFWIYENNTLKQNNEDEYTQRLEEVGDEDLDVKSSMFSIFQHENKDYVEVTTYSSEFVSMDLFEINKDDKGEISLKHKATMDSYNPSERRSGVSP